MTKAIIFDLDSCLAAADEVGGCSHRRLRPSARPTKEFNRLLRAQRVVRHLLLDLLCDAKYINATSTLENTEDRQAGRQASAKTLCDTKYIAATSTFEKQ